METVLIAAFTAAFVLSFIDYFRRMGGGWRMVVALAVATGTLEALAVTSWALTASAPAAAFLGLAAVSLMEWVLTRPVRTR